LLFALLAFFLALPLVAEWAYLVQRRIFNRGFWRVGFVLIGTTYVATLLVAIYLLAEQGMPLLPGASLVAEVALSYFVLVAMWRYVYRSEHLWCRRMETII
jgi:hypothetical protein